MVNLGDEHTRRIINWASALGVRPALSRENVDGTPVPIAPRKWCEDRSLIPLRDGRLLVTSQDHVSTGREFMRTSNIPKVSIIPTSPDLLAILLIDLFEHEGSAAISDVDKSEIEKRIHHLIEQAINEQASDIHIEVRPSKTNIKLRDQGLLRTSEEMSFKDGNNLVQVLFNVSADTGRAVYNPREPQDGSMVVTMGDVRVRVRLASMPAHPEGSIDAVLRVFPSNRKVSSLSGLGYSDTHTRLIRGALSRSHGLVLIAGPTGSGKTTTLAAMVSSLPTDEKTITIEDPPEYEINNVTQVTADTHNEAKNFTAMTRATMRMDPDNIMIGEVRDEDTAQMAMRAAITGHRVFSTIHAKSAISIVTRLVDFGIERSLLSDPDLLVALMYQRLVPTVCPHCAYRLQDNIKPFRSNYSSLYERLRLAVFENDSVLQNVRFKGVGCARCRNTGISGRTVVAEVIYLDQTGRSIIEEGQMSEWEAHLLSHGWAPLRDHMVEKVLAGIVSPIDAERVIGSLSESTIGASFNYKEETERLGGK